MSRTLRVPNREPALDFSLWIILACLGAGALAGLVAGLLGIGGGLVVVPALLFVLGGQAFPPDLQMHLAIGSSLATIVFTSSSSTFAHHRKGAVRWDIFWRIAPGVVAGGFIGSGLAHLASSGLLETIFGIFELAVAVHILLDREPPPGSRVPGPLGLLGSGTAIGALASFLGVGGGVLTVPFLLWCRVQVLEAVATSAVCTLAVALAGTAGFIVSGWNAPGLPAGATGYVYWPAVAGVSVASMLVAPLGAKLAHRLPRRGLKLIFAGLLAVVGTRLLMG
jgi:hypothetical protein